MLLELDSNDKVIKHYTIADELIGFEYDSADYCYVNNGHGDVAFVTDGTGAIVNTYSYTAYGTALICDEKVSNSFRYTGECYDAESGLYYLRARYMNPETGTFTQEDTYQGNIYDALSLHKYLYAQDNPVIYKDPTGNTISLVEHLIAAGQWVVDFAKTLWKLKTYSTFAKAAFVAQIVSLTAQIRSLIVSETLSEGIENFVGIFMSLVGILEIDYNKILLFLADAMSIILDLYHLYVDIVEENVEAVQWGVISLGCDLIGLICDIAGVKYDKQKSLKEARRKPYNRTPLQHILIDWTMFLKNNQLINDEDVKNLLNLAKQYGNWDDIWIILFHDVKGR